MSGSPSFEPTLDLSPHSSPLGFSLGPDCLGPAVEHRSLDAIRPSLMDPDSVGPDCVYGIMMDVGKRIHRQTLKDLHLLYGAVTYAQGRLGKEPVRSQGHIHKVSAFADGWSTPEVYQIWSGRAVIYMQESADDDPGRCFAIHADPGDVVIVPPAWAHATISADPDVPLTFGAWCDRDYGFEYEKVRAHKGLAWYPLVEADGSLSWHFNPGYRHAPLTEKSPEAYAELGIEQRQCIYRQFEIDPDRFQFVPRPDYFPHYWEGFIP